MSLSAQWLPFLFRFQMLTFLVAFGFPLEHHFLKPEWPQKAGSVDSASATSGSSWPLIALYSDDARNCEHGRVKAWENGWELSVQTHLLFSPPLGMEAQSRTVRAHLSPSSTCLSSATLPKCILSQNMWELVVWGQSISGKDWFLVWPFSLICTWSSSPYVSLWLSSMHVYVFHFFW